MDIERGLVRTSAGYLHYCAAGKGEPILLFHINQQSSAVYMELIEVLSRKYRPIAVDYPSYGMSDHISFQPTLQDYAKWMVELMDALGISNDDTGARTAREGARVSRTPPAAVRPSSTPPRARSRVL